MTAETLKTSPRATYVEHLRKGELGYQVDPDGKAVHFPRVVAPGSGAPLTWRMSQGLGTVYATTAMHARGSEPRNLVLVDMDEGFRVMSRVEGVDAQAVRIGQRVKFHAAGGEAEGDDPYPLFTLLEEANHG
ncbi:MAG: OB-fold domain-containing protein [Gammaproteobacteria bacterium]|nr:OB-fold domain-containing protein [Gammaproteobacteria bacterium]MBU1443829.1 OB-fold domain-containing protein [Gammaproteobacteria bacterium]MBU2288531.1 OB-fold domain-containing protein [Gammaproteobacteria bacterium]MBU2410344.1 OB-fold domain-containing protein [Gammaproteobacteria bacterium]